MDVSLKPEVEKFIDEQVKSGRYSSPAEAIEAGMARLMLDPEPDTLDAQDRADIRASLEEMDRGEVVDAKDLHAELRSRYLGR